MAKETIQYVETAEEKRWRAESDARALAEAEVIKNDPRSNYRGAEIDT